MSKIKIAIIDSGVDLSHPKLNDLSANGMSIKNIHGKIEMDSAFDDQLGHGTAIASIIYKIYPDAIFLIIKIFDEELVCKEDIMCEAIRYSIREKVDIINLSLGIQTSSPSSELYNVCKQATDNNIIMIAAAHHRLNTECYPAFFPEVFGITNGTVKKKNEYGYIADSAIEFAAKGTIQRVADINKGYKIVEGTSYACAHFTGIVASKITYSHKNGGIEYIRNLLINEANPEIKYINNHFVENKTPTIVSKDLDTILHSIFNPKIKFNWLNRLVLFPISEKEMKIFLNLPALCKYPVEKYLDYPKAMNPHKHKGIINRMLLRRDFKDFDTLVLGYFHEHLFQANVEYGYELVKEAVKNNKNFFVYDHHLGKKIEELIKDSKSESRCYTPIVDKRVYNIISHFKTRPNIQTPLLCVTGTTNKIGKFTTQLILNNLLSDAGYKTSFISTEPHGELFGAIFSFPFGYNDTVLFDYSQWPNFLRSLTKCIEYYADPDIIITGTQSWAIPPSFSMHPSGGEFDVMQYIFGIQPDAIICAINPNDSIALIQKTITGLNICCNAKVLFFVITPWQREFRKMSNGQSQISRLLSNEELNERIHFYQNELDIPVIDIMEKDNHKFVLNTITNYYK